MTITNENAAYIAGLFDGEGSIYYVRRQEKKRKHKGSGFRYANSIRIRMDMIVTGKQKQRTKDF